MDVKIAKTKAYGEVNEAKKNSRILKNMETQKDLGKHMHKSLKEAGEVDEMVNKINDLFTFIGKVPSTRTGTVRVLHTTLFTTLQKKNEEEYRGDLSTLPGSGN